MQIPLLPEHEAAIEAARQRSVPETTRRGYDGAWRRFSAWCDAYGYPAIPTVPEVVAAYLASLAKEGKGLSTIKSARAAVADRHRAGHHPSPTDSETVRAVMSGLASSLGGEQKQARPLDETAFAVIRRTAAIPRRKPDGTREGLDEALARGAEDIAIISVMRDAMLRVGEAAALVWSDVREWSDGSGRLYVRRSKTDQRAAGVLLYLGRQAMGDLERVRPRFHDDDDLVFRLRIRQMSNRIAEACRAAGLGEGFSGHSPRIGMSIDLASDGSGLPDLQQAGRWKVASMPARYIRGIAAGDGAVARWHSKRDGDAGNGLLDEKTMDLDFFNFLANDC